MYNSYAQQLIEVERRRRERRYGHLARLSQLKWIALCSFISYSVCTYYLWRHPLPLGHVWIDDVLVEVLEHNALEYVQRFFLWLSLLSGMAFILYYTFCNTNTESNTVTGSVRCNDNLASRTGSNAYCKELNKGNAYNLHGNKNTSSKEEQRLPSRPEFANAASSKLGASASSLRPSRKGMESTYFSNTELDTNKSYNINTDNNYNYINNNSKENEYRHSLRNWEHLDNGRTQSARESNMMQDKSKTFESIRTVQDLNNFLRENEKVNGNCKNRVNISYSNVCSDNKLRDNDNFNAYQNDCRNEFRSVQANEQTENDRRYDSYEKQQNNYRFMELDKVGDTNRANGNHYCESSADAYNIFTNNIKNIYCANDMEHENLASTNADIGNFNNFATFTTFKSELEHKIKQQWMELHITHPELVVVRVREWINEICEKLVNEIDESIKWFALHKISVFDATHSLKETVTIDTLAPATSPMAATNAFTNNTSTSSTNWAWGSNAQAQFQQQSQRIITPKRIALTEEKNRIQLLIQSQQQQLQQQQQQFQLNLITNGVENREYNEIIMRYNQRLSIEDILDITNTFAATNTLSNRELNEQRRYILSRLRKFAKERTLVSYQGALDAKYKFSDTNSNALYEEFSHKLLRRNKLCHLPCDAHIIVHILRTCVNGLSPLITFNYSDYTNSEASTKGNYLALFVGDVGAPYFYVRHRCSLANERLEHEPERMYVTHQGTNSLFEALAIIVVITHLYYNGNYFNGHSEFDIKKTGMIRIVSTMEQYEKEYVKYA